MSTQPTNDRTKSTTKGQNPDAVFHYFRRALENLQFGTVSVVVQNGRVVQIERHEKMRLTETDY